MAADEISLAQDLLIEFLKPKVDREVLRENLKLTVEERFEKLTERLRIAEAKGDLPAPGPLDALEQIAELEVLQEETQKQKL